MDATNRLNTGGTREENISPRQEHAIIALLHHPGLTKAAQEAGVGKTTLWNWMQQPAFREAYRQARREALSAAIAHLQQLSSEAAEVLGEIMRDPKQQGAARVGAAKSVIDYALKASEIEDLTARLEQLENEIGEEVA